MVCASGAALNEAAVLAHLTERLAGYKLPASVTFVEAVPKSASGKILRKTMRQIADGQEAMVPSTIEDPSVLEALGPILRGA